jgi:hydroxymethylpyrimidine/phosphomethylpyrimidine kinase
LRSIEELFKNYPIKAVKIGIVPSLAYLQEIVLALKGFAKNKDCLGHRSKIKYRIRLSQYQNQSVLGKNIKTSI